LDFVVEEDGEKNKDKRITSFTFKNFVFSFKALQKKFVEAATFFLIDFTEEVQLIEGKIHGIGLSPAFFGSS